MSGGFNFANYLNSLTGVTPNPPGISSIKDLMNIALNVAIGIGFSISLLSVGFAAFQFTQNHGDVKEIQKAWNTALWGVFAAVGSIAALAIKRTILISAGVTNTNLLNELPNL